MIRRCHKQLGIAEGGSPNGKERNGMEKDSANRDNEPNGSKKTEGSPQNPIGSVPIGKEVPLIQSALMRGTGRSR